LPIDALNQLSDLKRQISAKRQLKIGNRELCNQKSKIKNQKSTMYTGGCFGS